MSSQIDPTFMGRWLKSRKNTVGVEVAQDGCAVASHELAVAAFRDFGRISGRLFAEKGRRVVRSQIPCCKTRPVVMTVLSEAPHVSNAPRNPSV